MCGPVNWPEPDLTDVLKDTRHKVLTMQRCDVDAKHLSSSSYKSGIGPVWSVPSPELQLFSPTFLRSSKGWYWPQGLLSMPKNNSHKSWATPSDITSVSSASKSEYLTSSLAIPGQCNFSCSRGERMKVEFSAPQSRDFRLRKNTPTENGHVWRPGG